MRDTKFWTGCMFGFVVGIVIAKFFSSSFGDGLGLSAEVTSTTTVDYILATDQGAGDKVYVPKVSVGYVSWVAVRENNNGVSGRILGAQRLDAGTHENVLVDLLRPTTPQVMYAVVLYKDDGDGIFDPKIDELIMKNDEPVVSQFIAE